ncbi:MAG: protease complex subunit PrcB family protein [Firmicutes bacterium]|nr:protease complex subunit PrcB family protein [Bacillota bacterium]
MTGLIYLRRTATPAGGRNRGRGNRVILATAFILLASLLLAPGCGLFGKDRAATPPAGDTAKGPSKDPAGDTGQKPSGDPAGGSGGTGGSAPVKGVEPEPVTPENLPKPYDLWAAQNSRIRGTYAVTEGSHTYLLAAWGEQPTAGYTVNFAGVREDGSKIRVSVRLRRPGPGDMVAQVITYPYALGRIPAAPGKEIVFEVEGDPGFVNATEFPPANGAIIVETPEALAPVGNPLRIEGWARVYEATVQIRLEDGHDVLAETFTTADNAAPEWGRFRIDLPYRKPTNPYGHLILYAENAENGSARHQVMIPVSLDSGDK